MALARTSPGIEYDYTPIAVAVGNKHFVAVCIHRDGCGAAQMFGVVAVGGDTTFADLQQKLSIFGEFQDLPVAITVARQPDAVIGVDRYAVLAAAGTSIAIQAPLGRAGGALGERRMQSSAIKPFV